MTIKLSTGGYYELNVHHISGGHYGRHDNHYKGLTGYKESTNYDQCPHETQFTVRELETVKHYIQSRFARTNPLRPPCKTLHVRKDIKCMSKREMSELVDVFKTLYANGVMDAFALIHGSYWPYIHKFIEASVWHRWLLNRFELEMRKINPYITLPYWEHISDFAAPEKSSIWKTLGTAGDRHNGYCVPDGPFANQRVEFPSPHCLKRQWSSNKTIPVWEGPEWVTSINQLSKTWVQFRQLFAYVAHFKTHLNTGGYAGDMSVQFAPNDPLFYVFHAYVDDYAVLKWQLSDDQNLLPMTYNLGLRYDWSTHTIVPANVKTDVLIYYKTRVKETFQMGFGDLCYIHDQFVRPILDIVANKQPRLPKQVLHLEKSLPKEIFERYYPKFATKTVTFFDYFLPALPNNNNFCGQMPIALPFNTTANGRRQLKAFRTLLSIDITPDVFNAEQQYYEFMYYMKKYWYCSPYV